MVPANSILAGAGWRSTANNVVGAVDPGSFGAMMIRSVGSLTGQQNEPFIRSDRVKALPTLCRQMACQTAAEATPHATIADTLQRPVTIGSSCTLPAFLYHRLYLIG